MKRHSLMPLGMIFVDILELQLDLEVIVLRFVYVTNDCAILEIDLHEVADLKILHTNNSLGLLSAKQLKHFSPLVGFIISLVIPAICRQKKIRAPC